MITLIDKILSSTEAELELKKIPLIKSAQKRKFEASIAEIEEALLDAQFEKDELLLTLKDRKAFSPKAVLKNALRIKDLTESLKVMKDIQKEIFVTKTAE